METDWRKASHMGHKYSLIMLDLLLSLSLNQNQNQQQTPLVPAGLPGLLFDLWFSSISLLISRLPGPPKMIVLRKIKKNSNPPQKTQTHVMQKKQQKNPPINNKSLTTNAVLITVGKEHLSWQSTEGPFQGCESLAELPKYTYCSLVKQGFAFSLIRRLFYMKFSFSWRKETVIPAPGRLRQEDWKFEVILGYTVRM